MKNWGIHKNQFLWENVDKDGLGLINLTKGKQGLEWKQHGAFILYLTG
jgi:hypothetical protein